MVILMRVEDIEIGNIKEYKIFYSFLCCFI